MSGPIERGVVVSVRDGAADVRVVASAACEDCKGDCCRIDPEGVVIEGARNIAGAGVGDEVEIEVPEGADLTAGLIVYALPVAALLAGYVAGNLIGGAAGVNRDAAGAAGAVACVSAGLLLLRYRGREALSGERYRPVVRAIISHGLSPVAAESRPSDQGPRDGSEGKVST